MEECLSDNQIAALVSGHAAGASSDDLSRLEAHLDGCPRCLTIVAAALRAEAPAADSRFAIVRRLGSGGMGTVYEALDRAHNTRVALKVLRHVAPDTILRFKREFRALSGVRHPNLVRRGELLGDDDRWCFTMELLDGVRFLDFVRPGAPAGAPGAPGFDDARLRDAFRQLVHGLAALHADGKVHRDVKPSNVLVTAQGRVVLIDLGLVLDQRGDSESSGGNALGTVAYMAPEQALGKRVGPEADLYAAGVLLYQALTGELPFAGDPLAIVERKQRGELVEPRLCVPALAAPWNELCVALLHPAPGARPTVAEILRALDASAPPVPIALPCAPAPEAALPFIGRADQLHALRRALDDTRGGQPVVALVAGDAGLGKTALVQWFAASCRERGAVVLAGRCDARESLPFKAIDGIVDALSRYLARLPAIEVAAVLPRDAALLARTFPVLARVKPIADAPRRLDVVEVGKARDHVMRALGELLARLADRRPTVLIVDDMWWSDGAALGLLARLVRNPDAPALLLVVSGRGGAAELAAARTALGVPAREVVLTPLTASDARALAAMRIARAGLAPCAAPDPALVAHEAGAHPVLIDLVVRHAARGAPGALRLDDAVRAALAELEPTARAIVQLTALAAGGVAQRTVAHALALDGGTLERHLCVLCAASWIRIASGALTGPLEPYHARIRAGVLASLRDDEAHALRHALAGALSRDRDPDHDAAPDPPPRTWLQLYPHQVSGPVR